MKNKNFLKEKTAFDFSDLDFYCSVIDPTKKGFFDDILTCDFSDQLLREFLIAVKNLVGGRNKPFIFGETKPIQKYLDNHKHDFFWWQDIISKLYPVSKRRWQIMSLEQYYIYLVYCFTGIPHSL